MVLLALLAIGTALSLPYILKIGIDQYIAKRDLGRCDSDCPVIPGSGGGSVLRAPGGRVY